MNSGDADPLDIIIAAELWRWHHVAADARQQILDARSPLARSIEYFLCDVFRRSNSAESRGWWCDGVIDLAIFHGDAKSFRIVGAAFWGEAGPRSSAIYLAPWAIEFQFAAREAAQPSRVTVRFGAADQRGQIKRTRNTHLHRMIADRPAKNTEWALAVELV